MSAKHTDAPWHLDGEYIQGGRLVAKLCRHHFENDNATAYPEQNIRLKAEYYANVALISAAPELLEALKASRETIRALLKALGDNPHVTEAEIPDGNGISEKITAAISKAEGRT
jgi:hypothetical protein